MVLLLILVLEFGLASSKEGVVLPLRSLELPLSSGYGLQRANVGVKTRCGTQTNYKENCGKPYSLYLSQ